MAHAKGIHVTTAYRWYREGTLPVPARKVGRLILVSPETAVVLAPQGGLACMHGCPPMTRRPTARSPACRGGRRRPACPWVRVRAGVGSGMNGARARARRLLADPAAGVIVLEEGEVASDLVGDMIEVLTSLCVRRYGRGLARDRALEAVGCARRHIGPRAVLTAGRVWCGGAG